MIVNIEGLKDVQTTGYTHEQERTRTLGREERGGGEAGKHGEGTVIIWA